ncbi:MAG TPA: nicotinate-nucleotide adenylyltransferase [Miltoncostaeaceae bacterium]|nr:nicotinate-nucleotide adenylyltransferase [Miltoncostaeaceae bacterium]
MLGGTFDPPHLGHAVIAGEALWRLKLDEVLLIPARLPPHKPAGTHGDPVQRLRWTRALAGGRPGLRVRSDEIDRPGPSYTVDTLTALASEYPDASLWFIMGADQLGALPTWHRWRRIITLARIAAIPRAEVPLAEIRRIADRVAPGRVDTLEIPRVDISSTLVRERIAAGLPVWHLVPERVHAALADDGLVPSATVRTEGSDLADQ